MEFRRRPREAPLPDTSSSPLRPTLISHITCTTQSRRISGLSSAQIAIAATRSVVHGGRHRWKSCENIEDRRREVKSCVVVLDTGNSMEKRLGSDQFLLLKAPSQHLYRISPAPLKPDASPAFPPLRSRSLPPDRDLPPTVRSQSPPETDPDHLSKPSPSTSESFTEGITGGEAVRTLKTGDEKLRVVLLFWTQEIVWKRD
ncbi:unnamed protein product [Vicia faba]|uniref:Uncharacterized protein n=1 Tax=Vicia faba TaxID=3906 RepID=A0AAV0ZSW6_VICFA|nr:unnamed protein product [Vicia faba]